MQTRLSFHEIRMKLLADWKILTTDPRETILRKRSVKEDVISIWMRMHT